MISYKQWKTVNENVGGNFATVLSNPHNLGVVGATGASDWSLEKTKAEIRKYMYGESEEDEEVPAPKKKPGGFPDKGGKDKGSSPFGGGDSGSDDDSEPDDGMDGDDSDDDGLGDDHDDNDMGMGGDGMGGDDHGDVCPTCGKPMDDDGDDMGGDDHFGDDGDDMGMDGMDGDEGQDDLDDTGGMGMGDDEGGLGGDPGMGGGMMGMDGGAGPGGKAKGNVCDGCGHHEGDTNAKFCKMCGKCMSKFMKKYMSSGKEKATVKINGQKAMPWLDKTADNGEVKKGGNQVATDMFPTLKGGKKEPEKMPNSTGGSVKATAATKGEKMPKGRKNENVNQICHICGNLACEVHDGSLPSASRLNKSFFKSLNSQIGHRGGKYDDGMTDTVVEDALYKPPVDEPFPGEPGYAPTGRIGGFLGQ